MGHENLLCTCTMLVLKSKKRLPIKVRSKERREEQRAVDFGECHHIALGSEIFDVNGSLTKKKLEALQFYGE